MHQNQIRFGYMRSSGEESCDRRLLPVLLIPNRSRQPIVVDLQNGAAYRWLIRGVGPRDKVSVRACHYNDVWSVLYSRGEGRWFVLRDDEAQTIPLSRFTEDVKSFRPVDIYGRSVVVDTSDCSADGFVFHLDSGERCVLKESRGVSIAGFSSDGSKILGSARHRFIIWDATTGAIIQRYDYGVHAWSSDFAYLAIPVALDHGRGSAIIKIDSTNTRIEEEGEITIVNHASGNIVWAHPDHRRWQVGSTYMSLARKLMELEGTQWGLDSDNDPVLRHSATQIFSHFYHFGEAEIVEAFLWVARGSEVYLTARYATLSTSNCFAFW